MLSVHTARTLVHIVVASLLILATVLTFSRSAPFTALQAQPVRSELLAADDFTNQITLPIIGPIRI